MTKNEISRTILLAAFIAVFFTFAMRCTVTKTITIQFDNHKEYLKK